MGGDHQVGRYGCGGRGFYNRGCFLLILPSSPLGAAVDLGSGFFRSGRLPGGGHYRFRGRLRDRLRKRIRIGLVGGVMVALTTRPLGRRVSTPRPGPSARQRDRPSEI